MDSNQRVRFRLAGLVVATGLVAPISTQSTNAGLLEPVLRLMQPQVEERLAKACASALREAHGDLGQTDRAPLGPWLESSCQALAKPVSACLIREASRSGRELGVITELIRGQVGDDSTVVIRRCAAALIGLPAHQGEQLLPQLLERLRQ